MAFPKVADMTVEELKALIEETVDMRLQKLQQPSAKQRSLREILDAITRHRWTPPLDSPTLSEMIIEEREQWRKDM